GELGKRVDFGASYFDPMVSYQAQEVPGMGGAAVKATGKFDSQRGASPVPAFGLVLPIDEQLTFALGAYGISGMGVDFAQNLYNGVTYSSYSAMRFAPGLAFRATPDLSFGITANVTYANMGYAAAEGLLQVSHQAASAFGAGFTAGARYQAARGIAFGVAYES